MVVNPEGYALFVIVRDPDLLEPLLATVMEAGVSGVTIFSTRGISQAKFHRTVSEFSVAAVLSSLFVSEKHESKVLTCLVRGEGLIDELGRRIKEAVGDIESPENVIYFAVPITHLHGLQE